MKVSREYFPDKGIVVLTVENPPLATTRHTVLAEAIADGKVDLDKEVKRLEDEARRRLQVHEAVLRTVQ